jgi:hypothetical protein
MTISPSGTTNLEDRLHDALTLADLQLIAADIHICIGDGPLSTCLRIPLETSIDR